ALDSGDVGAKVDVVGELAKARILLRTGRHLALELELVDVAQPAVGALEQKGHYSVLRNTILYGVTLPAMARTGQPSTERIGSALRSFAILDVLAETGPLGTNELARRLGATPSTVSRQLGTLVAAG